MDDDTEGCLKAASIVPICLGLIFGTIGTGMAFAHGDYLFGVACLAIGIASAFGLRWLGRS
jgi:hypothetical protein